MARPIWIMLFAIVAFCSMTLAVAEPVGEAGYAPIEASRFQQRSEVVVVVHGDHLWKISDVALSRRMGRAASSDEIISFWLDVIELNLRDLRSGDPDLIYPGEEIRLPVSE